MADELIDVINDDRREVEAAITELEAPRDGMALRDQQVDQLVVALVRHAAAEELFIYPLVRSTLDDGPVIVEHKLEERAQIERLMKQLMDLPPGDFHFEHAVDELVAAVRPHFDDERNDLVPRLLAACSPAQIERARAELVDAKENEPTPPDRADPDPDPAPRQLFRFRLNLRPTLLSTIASTLRTSLQPARSDLAWRFLRDGYDAISEEREHHGDRDVFATRMLGRRTAVVRGPRGARLFTDPRVVSRKHAVPAALSLVLFGHGSIHQLDGTKHRRRKKMYLETLAPEHSEELVRRAEQLLSDRLDSWNSDRSVFDQLVQVFGRAAIPWAGIHVSDRKAAKISRWLAECVDGFGLAFPAYLRACRARWRLNRWATRVVRSARDRPEPGERPLSVIARSDLDDKTAAVELLNHVRPVVAVAWPATMAVGHLLQTADPEATTSDDAVRSYVLECRRLQPFTPALAGRVKQNVTVDGVRLRRGNRILLDVVGTDVDPHSWTEPGSGASATAFDPARFADREPTPYDYVPQGAGDPSSGHRCPGEDVTIQLMSMTLRDIARCRPRVTSSGPIDRSRVPARMDPALRIAPHGRTAAAGPGYRAADDGGARPRVSNPMTTAGWHHREEERP